MLSIYLPFIFDFASYSKFTVSIARPQTFICSNIPKLTYSFLGIEPNPHQKPAAAQSDADLRLLEESTTAVGSSTAAHASGMSKKGIITEETDMMHGSMVINEGQVESSTGSLIGQEHLAQIFQRLLQSGCAEEVLTTGERFKTVTIAFPQHYYTISRRGPKIYIARLAHNSAR